MHPFCLARVNSQSSQTTGELFPAGQGGSCATEAESRGWRRGGFGETFEPLPVPKGYYKSGEEGLFIARANGFIAERR